MQTAIADMQRSTRRRALHHTNDEDLMDQYRAGTVEAFDVLVSRYTERLQHYVYGFVRDRGLCEDMVQETFVRVHRNRHSYRRIARFSTWLYTIAGNIARSEYRKRKRRRVYSTHLVSAEDEDYEMQIADAAPSPQKRTEMRGQDEQIRRAIRSLPDVFREVIVLRDVQELSYKDVATITGLPMGTVKSRVHRGRMQIRRRLPGLLPQPEDGALREATGRPGRGPAQRPHTEAVAPALDAVGDDSGQAAPAIDRSRAAGFQERHR